MGRRHLSLVTFVVVALALLAPLRHAAAAQLPHHDLRSLALLSDAIVRVRIVDEPGDPGAPVTHQVLASYFGELEAGAEVILPHAGYSARAGPFGEGVRTFDDEAVLFLERAAGGAWRLTPSGLRRRSEGLVYRYIQATNPGPYVSVLQGHDPFDLYGDPRGVAGLTIDEFEVEVRAAIAGAAAIRTDLGCLDDPAARARLLDRVGPRLGDDRDEPTALWMIGVDDPARAAIIEGLWRAGHREDALAGVDRLPLRLGYEGLAIDADPGWLLDVARDRRRPTPLRRGALLLLEHDPDALTPPAALDRLIALLADPDPELRALAAGVDVARDTWDPRWRAALVARIREDEAPAARLALLAALVDATPLDQELDVPELLRLPASTWPVVAAERRARSFEITWATPRSSWEFRGVELRARPEGGDERAWTRSAHSFPVELQAGGLGLGRDRSWLLFDPELPAGAVDFDVRVRFVRGDEVKIVEPELRGLRPRPALASAPRVDGEGQAAPAPTPAPAGCACRLADAGGGSNAGALFLLLLPALRPRGAPTRSSTNAIGSGVWSASSTRVRVPASSPARTV